MFVWRPFGNLYYTSNPDYRAKLTRAKARIVAPIIVPPNETRAQVPFSKYVDVRRRLWMNTTGNGFSAYYIISLCLPLLNNTYLRAWSYTGWFQIYYVALRSTYVHTHKLASRNVYFPVGIQNKCITISLEVRIRSHINIYAKSTYGERERPGNIFPVIIHFGSGWARPGEGELFRPRKPATNHHHQQHSRATPCRAATKCQVDSTDENLTYIPARNNY